MSSEQRDRIEKALDEWRQTLPPIPDYVWQDLSAWIMSLRVHARDGHYIAYLKCLWRPPNRWGTRKAYGKVLGAFSVWLIQNGHARWPWSRTTQQKSAISNAPGVALLSLVKFFYSPETVEYRFEPIIADWHFEYFNALELKELWKARWISIRYTCRFIAAMGLSQLLSFIRDFLVPR